MIKGLVFCLLITFVFGNEVLRIYDVLEERGQLDGVPYATFYNFPERRIIFNPGNLDAYPCTGEPFFIHMHTKNAREEPLTFIPYNTYFEGVADHFEIFNWEDKELKAQYIGPVSSHIFPPPEDALFDMKAKIATSHGKYVYPSDYHFEFDLALYYEFPKTGRYRYMNDAPLIWYDREKKSFSLERYWGGTGWIYVHDVEHCIGTRFHVNEIRDEKQYLSCSVENEEKLETAWEAAIEMASNAIEAIRRDDDQTRHNIIDWFGRKANNNASKEKIISVFQKVVDFTPSVIQCEEGRKRFFKETTVDNLEELFEKFFVTESKTKEKVESDLLAGFNKNKDERDFKAMKLHCTPGMVSWLIPRDESNTIHICPAFFELNKAGMASHLIDSIIRFDSVASAKDYALGESYTFKLASGKYQDATLKNAASYSILAKKLYTGGKEIIYVDYI